MSGSGTSTPPSQPLPAGSFSPTSAPKNKVIAATGGAAVGSALAVILTWILGLILGKLNITITNDVSSAFEVIFTSAATLAAGYYTPPGASEGVVVQPDGSVKSAIKSG